VRGRPSLTVATAAVAGLLLLAGCGSSTSGTPSTSASTSAPAASSVFTVRPVECQAPAYGPPAGRAAATGALPACAPTSQLSTANLEVGPNPNAVNGYTANSIPPDPQFADYPSTTVAGDLPAATVLLGNANTSQGTGRFVLGPTAITGGSVTSAAAQLANGQWVVNVLFNAAGSAAYDALGRAQFHAYVAADLDATVLSAALVQPTTYTFTSFAGQMVITGASGQQQAQSWATEISHSH